jgi:hypothetical protein
MVWLKWIRFDPATDFTDGTEERSSKFQVSGGEMGERAE